MKAIISRPEEKGCLTMSIKSEEHHHSNLKAGIKNSVLFREESRFCVTVLS